MSGGKNLNNQKVEYFATKTNVREIVYEVQYRKKIFSFGFRRYGDT